MISVNLTTVVAVLDERIPPAAIEGIHNVDFWVTTVLTFLVATYGNVIS